MKKIISFILAAMILSQTLALTSCMLPTGQDNTQDGNDTDTPSENQNENPNDEQKPSDENEGENNKPTVNPDKYADFDLPVEKLEKARDNALTKINIMMATFGPNSFPAHNSTNNVYPAVKNDSGWTQGFYTGMLWIAYEMTGKDRYMNAALAQIPSYTNRIDNKLGTDTHDMGFLYVPSCVAAYKLTGDEEALSTAIKAADQLKSRYHEKGEFIQAWGKMGAANNYRLIVDCLMNIPLLYWATEATGDESYRDIAIKHFNTTVAYAFRNDGSTYHTYFFDPVTGAPLRGETHQGASDDSTWARGQAWAMYGPMLTYSYEHNEAALNAFIGTANYFLDYLPADYVPYWDLSFSDGAYQPKDSSSAAIAVCALLEGAKCLDESDPLRAKYVNAAKRIMNSLIDNYTTVDDYKANGLLLHATYNKNSNTGVDEMNIWGDYFYMEALQRMLDPEWDPYW